jgi:hypothetical protein
MAIECPKCGENLGAVSKIMPKSRISFAISPQENSLVGAMNFGGMVRSMSRLLEASVQDESIKLDVFIESLVTDDDGTLRVGLLVLARRLVQTEIPE